MSLFLTTDKKALGDRIPLFFDWTSDLARIGATSIMRSDWDVTSGAVTIDTPSFASPVTMIYVSGGTLEEIAEVTNTVWSNTGARLVKTFPLHIGAGVDGTDPVTTYCGVGPADWGVDNLTGYTGAAQLPFSRTVSPSNQKVYLAWPTTWGGAEFEIDNFPQTGAFLVSSILIGTVPYYLAESTDFLTATDLTVVVKSAWLYELPVS